MHSTVYPDIEKFIGLSLRFYFPAFAVTFVFYYVINIPQLVPYDEISDT